MTIRAKKEADTLKKITRIYALVQEMNKIAEDLKLSNVRVEVGASPTAQDPLGMFGMVKISFGVPSANCGY